MADYQNDINLKIKAGIPIIQIVSYEWRRIHGCLIRAARENKRQFFLWNNSEGIKKWNDIDRVFIPEKSDIREPEEALTWFQNAENNDLILLMEDLFVYFDSMQARQILGRLRIMPRISQNKSLVISQPFKSLPTQLEKDVYVLEIPLPDRNMLITDIREVVEELNLDENRAPDEDFPSIAESALGLTELEAKYAFKEISLAKNRLTKKEIPEIVERKEQIIKKSGILEYFHPRESFNDIGGLSNIKKWLNTRKVGFDPFAIEFGLTAPKGVLLLGVQGCGKSLVAKAIASEWNLPLLKFDLGKVFGGFVGESEANIRRALSIAEAISPSILWIDEIEKGLSGVASSGVSDSGTTARVFGTMLTWMQEKEKPVFVIATANNIEQLPPELLRKGRFDEIFFVDLPGYSSRQEIWKIHLKKRLGNRRYEDINFDLDRLAKESIGYSGAEIEEAINESLYIAYNQDREVNIDDIIQSLKNTYPLSKVMAENINNLRKWAKIRARLASDEVEETVATTTEKIPKLKQEVANPFID